VKEKGKIIGETFTEGVKNKAKELEVLRNLLYLILRWRDDKINSKEIKG